MAINWKKPIEFLYLVTKETWVAAKLVADDVKKVDRHRTHCIRYTDEAGYDAFFVIGADGREYDSAGSTVRVRNVPEKKRYTVVSFLSSSTSSMGGVSSETILGTGVPNMEVGKTYRGRTIVHVSEFELAN